MKRRTQERGEFDWCAEDLLELQSEPLNAMDSIFRYFGNVVISGCEVTNNTINDGMVSIDGVLMPFERSVVTFPCYIVSQKTDITRRYVDGVIKPVAYDYKAIAMLQKPSSSGYITVTSLGAERLLRLASDAIDDNSSSAFATSKAVCEVNRKIKIATDEELGCMKAKKKTIETEEVAIDPVTGKMYAPGFDPKTVITGLTTTAKTIGGAINELNSGKVETDLSNMQFTKNMSQNGYLKFPDGIMFQWGLCATGAYQVFFPISFVVTPFYAGLTAHFGSASCITAASYVELTANYLRIQAKFNSFDSNQNGFLTQTNEKTYWMVIGRWK